MSAFNTELDSINNICSLVGEILQLTLDIDASTENKKIERDCALINKKAMTIKSKAQRMENRLRNYKAAIESLGFKRVKQKRKQNDNKQENKSKDSIRNC